MTPEPVGLIGLGLLGSALADRWLGRGRPVIGYDLDKPRRELFGQRGGEPSTRLDDIASRCRRIIFSLPDETVSVQVARELLPRLAHNALIIDTTTGAPDSVQRLAEELAGEEIGYIDATVAGSSEQVRRGEALLLIGGEERHVSASRDLLEEVSFLVRHLGPAGSGARMKLVVNLVLGLNRAVLAEGLKFAECMDIDPQLALEVLQSSPAASGVMQTKGQKMIDRDFTPQARLRQHLKDVRLIRSAAAERTCPTPLSDLHQQLLEALVERDFGEEDNAAIIRAFINTDQPEQESP
jgi:3-hydroxyisobutyrate dehydrogenase-like beta-hydroxyacid dehydrogenase